MNVVRRWRSIICWISLLISLWNTWRSTSNDLAVVSAMSLLLRRMAWRSELILAEVVRLPSSPCAVVSIFSSISSRRFILFPLPFPELGSNISCMIIGSVTEFPFFRF